LSNIRRILLARSNGHLERGDPIPDELMQSMRLRGKFSEIRARMKIEDEAITAISISADFGVTNYRAHVRDAGWREGVFRGGKKYHQR
jgi:hypothetical protein